MYSIVLMAAITAGADAPDFCFRHRCGGCNGCYGGCNGCGGGGCWGGCGRRSCGCHGGCGCYAGCYGGCYGGCYNVSWGCGGCYGMGCAYAPVVNVVPQIKEPAPEPKVEPKTESSLSNKAKLVVNIPDDAKLYIDDKLMKTTAGSRTFNTPPLDKTQAYYYMLRAEVTRDGKTETQTKRVILRAGELVSADFSELATGSLASR